MKSGILIFGIIVVIVGYAIVNFVNKHGLLDFVSIIFILICLLALSLFYLAVKEEASHG